MSINRWRAYCLKRVEHRPPLDLLLEPRAIEQEILQGIEELDGMLR